MATTPASPKRQYADKPNPEALAALLDCYFLWKARREQEKRAKLHKARNRAVSIKI